MLSGLPNIIWAGVPVLCLNYLVESPVKGTHQLLLHLMLASDLLLGQPSNSSAPVGKSKPTFPQYAISSL